MLSEDETVLWFKPVDFNHKDEKTKDLHLFQHLLLLQQQLEQSWAVQGSFTFSRLIRQRALRGSWRDAAIGKAEQSFKLASGKYNTGGRRRRRRGMNSKSMTSFDKCCE